MREIIVVAIIVALANSAKAGNTCTIKSCCEVAANSYSHFSKSKGHSGIYNIIDTCSPDGPLMQGYCDAVTDGGGWLVVLRRKLHGNEDFNRFWSDYEKGFGDLNSEFWYGLKSLNCLTSKGKWELRIDFTFHNWTESYLHYKHFEVGPPTDNYRLKVSGFTGITPTDPFVTAGQVLSGRQFTTRDRDNDRWQRNCAVAVHGSTAPGGWWHSSCFQINLNYDYGAPAGGLLALSGVWYSPPLVEMKIRPTNCGYW